MSEFREPLLVILDTIFRIGMTALVVGWCVSAHKGRYPSGRSGALQIIGFCVAAVASLIELLLRVIT